MLLWESFQVYDAMKWLCWFRENYRKALFCAFSHHTLTLPTAPPHPTTSTPPSDPPLLHTPLHTPLHPLYTLPLHIPSNALSTHTLYTLSLYTLSIHCLYRNPHTPSTHSLYTHLDTPPYTTSTHPLHTPTHFLYTHLYTSCTHSLIHTPSTLPVRTPSADTLYTQLSTHAFCAPIALHICFPFGHLQLPARPGSAVFVLAPAVFGRASFRNSQL